MTRPAMPQRIALIEDDRDLLDNTLEYLQAKGYTAWGCESAEAFYKQFAIAPVDVVLADIGLPGEDGLSLTRHLRELPQVKIVIVSARGSQADRQAGLQAGADGYLVKPVSLAELHATIQALSKPERSPSTEAARSSSPAAVWRLERETWHLTAPSGDSVGLTSREFALLDALIAAQGETVTKEALTDRIYPARVINRNERLEVLLTRLRRKCQDAFGRALPIKTVHLVGYVFTASAVIR